MTNLLDPLGRKKSLILGNIPYFICWLAFYYSNSVQSICITLAVMGFIGGLLEAPIILYISEIAEPSIRTILLFSINFSLEIGSALVYFLGNQMPWRDATLICATVPIAAILFIIIVSLLFEYILCSLLDYYHYIGLLITILGARNTTLAFVTQSSS